MRKVRLALSVTLGAVTLILVPVHAFADGPADPAPVTGTLQNVSDQDRQLTVRWRGDQVSALPFRLRLLNEASPLAYSMDIRREPKYGDNWTAISLGRPDRDEDRSLRQVGVENPLQAEFIARGGAQSDEPPALARTPLERAARQVAIWNVTNRLPLTPASVPNTDLLRRAKELLPPEKFRVPLQPATHGVGIFIRETTANTVRLAVILNIDANTYLEPAQNIDLYLDGIRCPIRTKARTTITRASDGTYGSAEPQVLEGGSTGIAEVEMTRNTKVVDASAVWVNVESSPGLVLVGSGSAPPAILAETVTLNYRSTTRLSPSDYTGPRELLDQAGTALLAAIHSGWLVWVVLLVALYLLPRLGRLVDWVVARLWKKLRPPPPAQEPPAIISTFGVEVTAPSIPEAVETAQSALGGATDLQIVVLEQPRPHVFRPDRPAKVRVTRST
jgi:hypothetical protein